MENKNSEANIKSPKNENVTDFPKAPAMKDTRKTGEVPKGTSYLRGYQNKVNK